MAEMRDIVVWSQDRDIIAAVCEPEAINGDTGFLLVIHGHGNNRFQYAETMRKWSEEFNLISICAEYRDSGRDSGLGLKGSRIPYDGNYKQVMDSLNSLRAVMLEHPEADQQRVLVWGGSQGAGAALICAEYAPNTFAACMALCGRVRPPEDNPDDLLPHQIAIRTVGRWLDRIKCPVLVAHGTADEIVPDSHSREIEEKLRALGKEVVSEFVEGGDHFLRPHTTRQKVTLKHCRKWLEEYRIEGQTDFERKAHYDFDCGDVTYRVDFKDGWVSIRPLEEGNL